MAAATHISAEVLRASGLFPRIGPDPSARSWGHVVDGKTWSVQHRLPKQPLPSLESSCQRYLAALRPLQSHQEHQASTAAVDQFLRGDGPTLHAQLEAYDNAHANWFEHFCYEAFLHDESPVVLNSNAFCSFMPDPDPSRRGQILRAAALARSMLEFANSIREDRLPVEELRGVPQCMYQYWWLFGTTRVPGEDRGHLRMDADARHIMVMCRGQIYRLDVLKPETYEVVAESDMAASLQWVVDDARALSDLEASQTAIGVFTTEHQMVWAKCRRELEHASICNGRNFTAIDTSLFVLCLDDSTPKGRTDSCENMLRGTTTTNQKGVLIGSCSNRWYDKLALIVCANGEAGMNYEHTCTDGSVDIRLACDVYKGSRRPAQRTKNVTTNGTISNVTQPSTNMARKLIFDIPSTLSTLLAAAQNHLLHRISCHQLEILEICSYGKELITSAGLSPDAFFQMGLHAAYTSLDSSASLGNGFEPVLMRQYLHGRTDVARSLTPEAVHWIRTFLSATASMSDKITALRAACAAHVANFKACAAGQSHHRHLYVLAQLHKRRAALCAVNGLPVVRNTIFEDPGWGRLGTTELMASNIDNAEDVVAGFGAPSPHGFTVVYCVGKQGMSMSVNSRDGRARAMRESIERVFEAMKILVEAMKAAK